MVLLTTWFAVLLTLDVLGERAIAVTVARDCCSP